MQGLEGVREVGTTDSLESALALAKRHAPAYGCVGAIRGDLELPFVLPRDPSGAPGGGWRDRHKARKLRRPGWRRR